MAKFKIVKVHSFRVGGKRYSKGDTIELSEADAKRLTPCDFLEPVHEPATEEPEKPKKPRK
ncbi:hypothetical protein G4O51_12560 [Candidatus Bathyarchaeota archaeon A05DMB-2]|jgi:hypothetical protein|nr:hypothetical protein [Candidatus Bathyarchaeota archaeon A05DMB-2]